MNDDNRVQKWGSHNRLPDSPRLDGHYRCRLCKQGLLIPKLQTLEVEANSTTDVRSHVGRLPAGWIFGIASLVLLVMAIGWRWPSGFYTLLRFVVCGSAMFLCMESRHLSETVWMWIMGVAALLFNPLIPFHLSRGIWSFLDAAAALLFVLALFLIRSPVSATPKHVRAR